MSQVYHFLMQCICALNIKGKLRSSSVSKINFHVYLKKVYLNKAFKSSQNKIQFVIMQQSIQMQLFASNHICKICRKERYILIALMFQLCLCVVAMTTWYRCCSRMHCNQMFYFHLIRLFIKNKPLKNRMMLLIMIRGRKLLKS